MIINLARRAHDHNWELDPITRSLLDTDFYKLLMLQFIWKHFPDDPRHFHVDQSLARCPSATLSISRIARATGSNAQAALPQVGTDLAGRQHVLRTPRHLRAGISSVAGARFSSLGFRSVHPRRPDFAPLRRPRGPRRRCGRFTRSPPSMN